MAARHTAFDGRVQLYHRAGGEHWHCSASVGGRQFRKSTNLESLSQAKDFAEDWYINLKGVQRWGRGLAKGKVFRKAAEKFLEEYEVMTGGQRSQAYVEGLRQKINKHLNPFFGDKPVTAINESLVQDYRVQRAKSIDKDGKPKPPARTTMHHEIITLRHVLMTAKRHGWITHIPDLSAPYKASGKVSHRAWFSPEEYQKFYRATRKRAKSPLNPKWLGSAHSSTTMCSSWPTPV